jgi:hypothetical protein
MTGSGRSAGFACDDACLSGNTPRGYSPSLSKPRQEANVPDPIAVLLRFNGDPDDLLGRFEQALGAWVEAQNDDYSAPTMFAICRKKNGIVVLSGWENVDAHKAFGQQMGSYLEAVGMTRPDEHEHLRIAQLGLPPA